MALRDYVLEDGSWDKLKIKETVLEFFDRSDAVVCKTPKGVEGCCRYRLGGADPDISLKHARHRCAFGVLIGDDEYHPYMEGNTSTHVLCGWFPTIYGSVGQAGHQWMSRLQMAHDGAVNIDAVREHLRVFFRDVK